MENNKLKEKLYKEMKKVPTLSSLKKISKDEKQELEKYICNQIVEGDNEVCDMSVNNDNIEISYNTDSTEGKLKEIDLTGKNIRFRYQ